MSKINGFKYPNLLNNKMEKYPEWMRLSIFKKKIIFMCK